MVLKLLIRNLLNIMLATTNGTLADTDVEFADENAACVILASGGYPQKYATGKVISGLEKGQLPTGEAIVYHAGTKQTAEGLVTSGGRVLGVTATAPTLAQAVEKAYAAADKISFEGLHRRSDIGKRALAAKQ